MTTLQHLAGEDLVIFKHSKCLRLDGVWPTSLTCPDLEIVDAGDRWVIQSPGIGKYDVIFSTVSVRLVVS